MPPSGEQQRPRGVAPLVVLAALVAVVTMAVAIWWRPVARITGIHPATAPSASLAPGTPSTPATPVASAPAPSSDHLVQAPSPVTATAPLPPATLAAALARVKGKGTGTTSGVVLDADSGAVLWQYRPDRQLTPASTLKLLTSEAALDALGPDRRFTTRVVQASPTAITLVGGGDPFLASTPAKGYPQPATSATLAAQTARALKARHVTTVSLGYDDSLFTGPDWHRSWPASYTDQVTHVSALWIDKGRPRPTAAPSATPSLTAATVFAGQLTAQGIRVAPAIRPVRAAAGQPVLGSVESLPVRTLVAQTLTHSDNSAAEVLLRQVGLATGNGGSFSGGVKGVQQRLVGLDVWRPGDAMTDGSGLGRGNHVSAATLTAALRRCATTPELSPVLEGLPVAGVTGTLSSRFYAPQAQAGRGWVSAKTGTLTKVSTLAGATTTRSGHDVVFAFMSNNAQQEWDVRTWLDDMAAAVAAS